LLDRLFQERSDPATLFGRAPQLHQVDATCATSAACCATRRPHHLPIAGGTSDNQFMSRRFQLSFRDALRWALYVCLAIGALVAYGRFAGHAQRDARQQAIESGRLKLENR
jgi:hypothetical protein